MSLLADEEGYVTDELIARHVARAKGGFGLIDVEATGVNARKSPKLLRISDDKFIPGLKKMTDAVHEYGCKFFMELYHPGNQGISEINGGILLTPSGIQSKLTMEPVRAMTLDEIEDLIDRFISGAVRCQKAGIDGVLVHGAHGYLLNQFLSPYTNKRDDEYGGSVEGRARMAVKIIEGIKEACGADYPVGIRLTANEYLDYNGQDPEEGITLELTRKYVKLFEAAGVDLIDISSGNYETMNTAWEPVGFEQGWKLFSSAAMCFRLRRIGIRYSTGCGMFEIVFFSLHSVINSGFVVAKSLNPGNNNAPLQYGHPLPR